MKRSTSTSQRGSATIEAVIVLPAFMLFVSLIIAAGRVQMAHQSLDAAAAEAARAASISRTAGEAQTRALATGQQALLNQGLACSSTNISVDTSGFAVQEAEAGPRRRHRHYQLRRCGMAEEGDAPEAGP